MGSDRTCANPWFLDRLLIWEGGKLGESGEVADLSQLGHVFMFEFPISYLGVIEVLDLNCFFSASFGLQLPFLPE